MVGEWIGLKRAATGIQYRYCYIYAGACNHTSSPMVQFKSCELLQNTISCHSEFIIYIAFFMQVLNWTLLKVAEPKDCLVAVHVSHSSAKCISLLSREFQGL